MGRNKRKDFLLLSLVGIIILSLLGIKLISDKAFQPRQGDAAYYTVFQDEFVKVDIIYSDKNRISDDGTTFVSRKGQYSNDILLVVENLRKDGLIFTPTPNVTIVNSQGNIVSNLNPYIKVAGIANSEDSTYISLTNPIPDYSAKIGKFSYIIDLQYQYIFYDRVNNTEQISITIQTEVINPHIVVSFVRFGLKAIPYIITIILTLVIFKRRK